MNKKKEKLIDEQMERWKHNEKIRDIIFMIWAIIIFIGIGVLIFFFK